MIRILNLTKIVALLFLGLYAGCVYSPGEIDSFVDTDFTTEVRGFSKLTGIDLGDASIKYMSLLHPTVGICNYITRSVKIDPHYWNTLGPLQKRALMYHELAHCFCMEGHDEDEILDGCSKSLMYPSQQSLNCLTKHWKYYKMDIKERCK